MFTPQVFATVVSKCPDYQIRPNQKILSRKLQEGDHRNVHNHNPRSQHEIWPELIRDLTLVTSGWAGVGSSPANSKE